MEEYQYVKGLKFILNKWKYVVISTILAIIISVGIMPKLHKTKYIASMSIILSVNAENNLNTELLQNKQLIYNYNTLIKNEALLAEIIERNNYNYSIEELKGMIETEIAEDTTITKIKVKNSEEEKAIQILTEIINELKEEIKNIYYIDNIHTVKDVLTESEENFNLKIIQVSVILLAIIASLGAIALYAYFNKIIMAQKNDTEVLGIEIIGSLKKNRKDNTIENPFYSLWLFFKKKNSKVIGFLGDKCCKNQDKIILETAENMNNKRVLIIKYSYDKVNTINEFLKSKEYHKTGDIEKDHSMKENIQILKSKKNNIDILIFSTNKKIIEFAYEEENIELLENIFSEYDYVFISLEDSITSNGTKIFVDLCDTVITLNRNYSSKEEELEKTKEYSNRENVKNIGMLFI